MRAAEALRERQRLVAALPTVPRVATPPSPVVAAEVAEAPSAVAASLARADAAARPAAVASAETAPSEVSVQSVLAVAGAGLFAIAAIVFTFLNPDVGFAMRTTVIAVVTAIFFSAAWLLRWRGVRFSAEAIGALGMVFLALDIWAFSEKVPEAVSGWAFAGLGTLIASLIMLGIAWFARMRTWLWASLVGLAVVPAFFGYAGDGWSAAWGHVGVIVVALAAHEIAKRATTRFESRLRADHGALTTLQVIATAIVILQLPFLGLPLVEEAVVVGRAALLAALAGLAVLSVRNGLPRFWSYSAGALATVAVVMLPFAIDRLDPLWLPALAPVAASVVLAASGFIVGDRLVRARPTQIGALTVALAVGLPAAVTSLEALAGIMVEFARAVVAPGSRPSELSFAGADLGSIPADSALAALLGVSAVALGVAVLALGTRRSSVSPASDGFPVAVLCLALWLGAFATLALIAWSGFLPITQVVVGVVAAVLATAAVLLPWSRFASARSTVRVPFIALAHVALVEAALISWNDSAITVPFGVAIAVAFLFVARAVPAGARAVHVAVAYAYGLVLVATALDRAGLDTVVVLCLTATVGALFALAATMVSRVDARTWYAILIVSVVPFLLGVASVLIEPKGWAALSTGATFLLASALVLTRRPGLNRLVRSAAAALLVPALAVVAVCLGSEFLTASASPIVLPIIALIVAVVLPSTKVIEARLVKNGVSPGDATAVRIWVEVSSLVTAAIAVLLALVREAAGLDTAASVLVILGLGAAATSVIAERRYGWWLAGASWTGALWCLWARLGVDVVEPYTLPPAIAAAVVAAILVARGRRGVALFTSALACALVPSLVILGIGGGFSDSAVGGPSFPWRTAGLLAASVVLLAFGRMISRRADGALGRVRLLRVPVLAGAILAASAGPIQAVRYGLGLDPIGLADPDLVMLPALALSFVGAALAVAAAAQLIVGSETVTEPSGIERWLLATRWLFAPAVVYLAVGPIAAVRRDWISIWSLWGLMAVFLALAIITVVIARRGRPVLPPFWFTYAVAWITGVTGWSERDLRVEVFSLPLGLTVLLVGVIAMKPTESPVRPTLASWPLGFTGSWRLLAPGIVLTLLPSVLATGTDPQLYRPILVIALALVAILVGAIRRLAAPFILGLVVLPIENVVVFAAQIDRTVGAMPWWITLATAGAVLLAIAVASERRTNQGRGVAALLRELN